MTDRPQLTLIVDGAEVPAYDGDTVASVLWRAGRTSWRRTRLGDRPRGMFCGIGACHDCLVTVDGVTGVRACLAPVRDGAQVTTADSGARDE